MANYYTSGSIAVELRDLDVDQVKLVLERVAAAICLSQYEQNLIENPNIAWELDDFTTGYTIEIDEEDGILYVYDEEDFNPEHVERLLLAFAAAFNIEEPFTAMWCSHCDKPRPNAFTGCGFVVQHEQPTKWFSIHDQITEYLNEIRVANERTV